MENDLKFSGVSPVVIDYNGSTDDIYAPVRGSSCDVNIVSQQILDDLYTPVKDDIVVRIKRDYIEYQKVMDYSRGVCRFIGVTGYQVEIYDGDEFGIYTIDDIKYQFTDIDGDLNMRCDISTPFTGANPESDVWLKARKKGRNTIVFDRMNKWNLSTSERYFYVGTISYKHDYTSHYPTIYVRTPGSPVPGYWTRMGYYFLFKEDNTQLGYGSYVSTEDIVHFEDGTTEMISTAPHYEGVYTFQVINNSPWGGTVAGWKRVASYYVDETSDRVFLEGRFCPKVKLFNNEREEVEVTDVGLGYTSLGGPSNVYTLDHTTHTCKVRAVIPNSTSSTPANEKFSSGKFFTDADYNLFLWNYNGDIICMADQLSWESYDDLSEFAVSGSFNVEFYFAGVTATTYTDSRDQDLMFFMSYWDPAQRIYYRSVPVSNSEYLWEGYMTPNTYSQSVTQNLDNITMTAIDPVSILKYVTIDHLFTKPQILTYREILGQTLSYVMLSKNALKVERTVSYGGEYSGSNGLLDLKVQVSNFWDESGEPATAYDMIGEMLRPFSMVLAFNAEGFQIYNQNRTEGVRVFDKYNIQVNGTLSFQNVESESTVVYDYTYNDWKSNNTQEPSIEIGSTYDKVTGVASTLVPSYSQSVFDIVDYNQRDKYSIYDLNVEKNKTKGYRKVSSTSVRLDTADAWYYLWNGVYTDEIYHLESHGGYVNGYLNMNKANYYLYYETGHPSDYGSILNFYGGTNNPTGTGTYQDQEKPVEVHKRITAYAPDNGLPLEFWEQSIGVSGLQDLIWGYSRTYDQETGYETPHLSKAADSRGGIEQIMSESNRIVYSQEYNINLSSLDEHTIDFNLIQSYSRTGIDSQIDVYQNNTCDSKMFDLSFDDDTQKYNATLTSSSSVAYFPALWNASSVKVDTLYFSRYKTSSTIFRPSRLLPVWDKRKVMMYIKLSDNSVLQFNGKEWISDLHPENANSFYLMKMMNGENLYHTDFRYNLIETSDGEHYSLTNERYTYYTDEVGGVVDHSVSGGHNYYCEVYKSDSNTWNQWVDKCGEGQLSINMPLIDDLNAKVCVDVYNSTMLGMTGSNNTSGGQNMEKIYYTIEGTGKKWDDDQQEYVYITLSDYNTNNYGSITGTLTYIDYLPYNTSYVKGEHLDLEISVSVPESNLGQMFSESDIQYTIDKKKNYVEEFNGPSFQVNTYNNLVHSSFSYLIFGSDVADPGNFIIAGMNVRPECFAVQAYMNWLSEVRKIYKKTLVPKNYTYKFSNIMTFIKSPEVSTNKLMVITDSWDLKTNRHSITSVECHDLDVDSVESFIADELPRRARAERYNLPTAYRKP